MEENAREGVELPMVRAILCFDSLKELVFIRGKTQ